MMIICSKCGNKKEKFRTKCLQCSHTPRGEDETAEAFCCSEQWLITRGLSKQESRNKIKEISKLIAEKKFVRDPKEISDAKLYLKSLHKESNLALLRTLRVLSPFFLIILIAGVLFFIKHCA